MDASHLLACQFGRWYFNFQHVTFQSRIIEVPEEVTEYLLQDGVYVAASSNAVRVAQLLMCSTSVSPKAKLGERQK